MISSLVSPYDFNTKYKIFGQFNGLEKSREKAVLMERIKTTKIKDNK